MNGITALTPAEASAISNFVHAFRDMSAQLGAAAEDRYHAGSNLAVHAWDELNRAGLFTGDGDFYGGMTGRAVMDLVDVFVEQGHSGTSASVVINLLRRLLAFEPLSPLTDDPAEWMAVTDGLWQSRRQSRAFSNNGGKTYRLNGERDTLHTAVVSGLT